MNYMTKTLTAHDLVLRLIQLDAIMSVQPPNIDTNSCCMPVNIAECHSNKSLSDFAKVNKKHKAKVYDVERAVHSN